jgi:transposase
MYLRTSRQKAADGSIIEHLQIVESVWDKERGRSMVRLIYSCGRAEDPAVRERLRRLARGILRRLSPEEIVRDNPDWKVVDAWPYGDIYVLEQLWRRIGMHESLPAETQDNTRLKLPVERACFSMVANRCCAPSSKLYCFEQWLQEDVHIEGARELDLHHLYRSMDFFEKHKEALEKELYFRVADLFSADVDLVFYDTTTLHCEIEEEDCNGAEDVEVQGSRLAGSKKYEALRQRGKAKNKRTDVPQIIVGLAMTRDGLPIRSWVFRGDTVDVTTVEKVKSDLRGWKLTRSIFVGDAGMVSKENLKLLARGGGKYIVCVPMAKGDEVTKEVLTRPGRYKRMADNLHVKEVVVGDGERRRRYAMCFNPKEAERQKRHREQVIRELEEMLPHLRSSSEDEGTHTKRICQLRSSERYGKYLKLEHGRLEIDRRKAKAAARHDGKFVVHTNDDSLNVEDMALGYKQLMLVERAWRLLKSGIKIRPVFHWMPHRICAHVSLTMIALLLERLAENACGDTWRNIRDDLKQIKLVQFLTPHGPLWQVTEARPAARNRLNQLGIKPPPPVFKAP